jgi:hypothetical protein
MFWLIATLSLLASCAARPPQRQPSDNCVHCGSLLSAHSAQRANCVTVRVLHEKNAKPIKGVYVSMSLAYFEDSTRQYESVDIGKTDKQGITGYCFNDHLPESFSVGFYEFSGPAEGELFKPGDVIPDVKPGEVIALGERWWLVDRWIGPWP